MQSNQENFNELEEVAVEAPGTSYKPEKKKLSGKKVAIVITDGFEESEFSEPYRILTEEDARVDVISLKSGVILSWKDHNWGNEFPVDKTIDEVNAQSYDALVLPGGVIN